MKLKKWNIALIVTLLIIFNVNRPHAEEEQSYRYIAAVLFNSDTGYLEYDVYPDPYKKPTKYMKAYCKANKYFTPDGDGWGQCITDKTDSSTKLLFPGGNTKENAKQSDLQEANKIVGTLVMEMNNALDFVLSHGENISAKADDLMLEIASCTKGNKIQNQYTCTTGVEGRPGSGLEGSKFVQITDTKSNYKAVLIYSIPKSSGIDITWMDIYSFAKAAAVNSNLYADSEMSGFGAFYAQSELGKQLKDFSDTEFASVDIYKLGLPSIEDNIMNRNNREYAYYLGLMPYQWWNVGSAMFWFFEIVGVFILIASVFYLVYKQNYAIISPIERLQIQDMIANLLMAILFMIIYVPIFFVIAKSNDTIVHAMDEFVGGRNLINYDATSAYGSNVALGFWNKGIKMINFFIIIRININYLTRAITILALHMIAPAAIATMAWQGRTKGTIFNTWFRELIAAILMQTFDAMILALYIMLTNYGSGLSGLQSQFLCFTFIPLNQFFKEKLTGTQGIMGVANEAFQQTQTGVGRAQQYGDKAISVAAGTAKTVTSVVGAALAIPTGGASLAVANGINSLTDSVADANKQVTSQPIQTNNSQSDGNVASGKEEGGGKGDGDPTIGEKSDGGMFSSMSKSGNAGSSTSRESKRKKELAKDVGLALFGAAADMYTMNKLDSTSTAFSSNFNSMATNSMSNFKSTSSWEAEQEQKALERSAQMQRDQNLKDMQDQELAVMKEFNDNMQAIINQQNAKRDSAAQQRTNEMNEKKN